MNAREVLRTRSISTWGPVMKPPSPPRALESVPTVTSTFCSALAQHAGGVGFVDDKQGVIPLLQRHKLSQGRQVAVHREKRVGDDEAPPVAAAMAGEQHSQPVDVGVCVSAEAGAAGAGGVDNAGVVKLVAQDEVFRPGDGGDGSVVGHPARGGDYGGLGALKGRKTIFELPMDAGRSADQPGGPRPNTPEIHRFDSGGLDRRVTGEREIVVAAEAH